MRRLIASVLALSLLSGVGFAKGPQGAGIGDKVRVEAHEQKGSTEKGIGSTVREEARDKERIQEHKEIVNATKSKKKKLKEEKKTQVKAKKGSNSTGSEVETRERKSGKKDIEKFDL
ncbi:MAG: hypothetical protein ACPLSJ_00795 [Thermosulfidibacteraceae bacterium]|jgi:hypothetical protein